MTRRLASLVTTGLLAAVVAACSTGGAASPSTPAASAGASADASAAPSAAAATGFTWTDGSGKTVTLDAVPKRIIAHAYAAAALMEFGIKPIAVYADMPLDQDVGLKNVDFTGIEVLGEEWGKIDVEKAASLASPT